MALLSLLVKLGMDSTEFKLGIKQAQEKASEFGKKAGESIKRHFGSEVSALGSRLAGMFTVGAATDWIRSVTDAVGEIKDMSELLAMSTDEVQKLQLASDAAGQSFNTIANAMQRVEQLRAQALAGEKGPSGLFALLGIDPSKGSASDIIKQALSNSQRGVAENAAAFELLGKKAQGLRLVFDELQKQGPVQLITQDEIDKIDAATKKIEASMRMLKIASAPYIAEGAEGLSAALSDPAFFGKQYAAQFARQSLLVKMAGLDPEAFFDADQTAGGVDLSPLDLNAALASRAGNSSIQTLNESILRSAIANEATFRLLEERTR